MSVTEKTDKRDQILQVAEQLFSDKGFDGTSVRDIAEQANVNLAMISYYFGSKEKLLKSLIEERFSTTNRLLEEKSNNEAEEPWEKIEWLIDFYVDRIVNTSRFHCIISHEYNSGRSDEIKDLITQVKSENMERIKKIILEGQRKNVFRKVDVELTMASMMGTIIQMINYRALYGKLLRIDHTDEENYRKTIAKRLKPHLKQMMRAHLLGQ
jgi:AcrR family transcriptional regulator